MKKLQTAGLIMVFLAGSFFTAFAQEARSKTATRTETIKLKYSKAQDLYTILMPYKSREGIIQPLHDLEVITLADYPENIEKMLAVIKELDVKPVDLLFTVQLILGSETDESKTDEPLANDPVIKELRNLLKYRSYVLLDTSLIRAMDLELSEVTLGKNAELLLRIRPRFIKEEKKGVIQIGTELRRKGELLQGQNPQRDWATLIGSNFTIKPGEKTVVGVSKMDGQGKGLILIISGIIVN